MALAFTLVATEATDLAGAARAVERALDALGLTADEAVRLGSLALDWRIEADDAVPVRTAMCQVVQGWPVDVCVQPWAGRRKRLLVADMDSTVIGCECLDELADFAGLKAEIAAITERAMRGEIAFEPALRERVAKLKGLPVKDLQRCYDERVRLNPGARTLVRTMAASDARCLLVSGGFEFFTARVAQAAGFQAHRANRLLEAGGRLTGEVAEPVLGREAKLETLVSEAGRLGLPLSDSLAVGDGANDLLMIEAAGLGVAYRAKPVVAEWAAARVDHADLTALLYFQGYTEAEFVRG